jgi:hypothetical protein
MGQVRRAGLEKAAVGGPCDEDGKRPCFLFEKL